MSTSRSSSPDSVDLRRSPVGPVLVWVALQLLAFSLSAARVPLAAEKSFTQPAEVLAADLMLVVHIGGAALLFPFLLRDAAAAALVIAASWPTMILASLMTGQPFLANLIAGPAYVTLWLVGLALWRSVLRTPRSQAGGVAVATLASLGAFVGWYAGTEWGRLPRTITAANANGFALAGPIFGAFVVSDGDPRLTRPWMAIGAHVAVGLLVAAVGWRLRRRAAHRPPRPNGATP